MNKETLGTIAALLAFASNGAYFISTFKNRIKPHVFSWAAWGLMTAITFFAQNSADAGPGSWHIAANSFCCFSIAALAFVKGDHDITKSDIFTFLCSLSAIPVWFVTHQALSAILVVICVETFAYYPTFRKGYFKPREEMASAYVVDSLRALLSIPALESYSATTLLYPLFAIVINSVFVSMILLRRRTPD